MTLFVLGRVLVDICIVCPFSLSRCGGSVEGREEAIQPQEAG